MNMHKLKYSLDEVKKMIDEWEVRGWNMYVIYVQLALAEAKIKEKDIYLAEDTVNELEEFLKNIEIVRW